MTNSDTDYCPVVLIIDDQTTSRMVLTEIIRSVRPSADIRDFENPLEALQWAASRSPDLILTDYKMPEMDGIDVVRRFRARVDCDHVPIVVITVAEEKDVRYKALEAGATDFLVKPIDPHECRARCHNLLVLSEQHWLLGKHAEMLGAKLRKADRLMRGLVRAGAKPTEALAEENAVTVSYEKLYELTSVVNAAQTLLQQTQKSIAALELRVSGSIARLTKDRPHEKIE
jgi:CheY-like chemotaxis protein